jgi:TPR repeat protein
MRWAWACLGWWGCAGHINGPYTAGFTARQDEAACTTGGGEACRRVAEASETGMGVPESHPRADALYDRACQLGDDKGCVSLAIHIASDIPRVADGPRRAVALFERTCQRAYGPGCMNLAYAYGGVDSHGTVTVDHERAHVLFEKACTLGEAFGCMAAGLDFAEGRKPFSKDMARAFPLYEKACDMGHGDACLSLSAWYGQGIGVPADSARSKEYWDRACKIIHHEPCVMF